jgi:RNA polymerase sigma factor (sigma-70 family)
MATSPMDRVIRHLRTTAVVKDGAGRTDAELLTCFIEQQDEAAFEALLRRHGLMVLGVCRRVLRNLPDAEDAFQATFLVLVRKAASIVPRAMVGNWLYGVAHTTAWRAHAATARRRLKERQVAAATPANAGRADAGEDLGPLLDRELACLPDKYRVPIVLCDLEDKTIKEAARHLGWPPGTVAGRLARGRKMLAGRLARRGLVLSAGAVAGLLPQKATAVSTSLVLSTVKAARVSAAGQAAVGGVISSTVAALTEGVLKTMWLTKLKPLAAALVVLALVAFGGGLLTYPAAEAQEGRDRKAAAQLAGPSLKAPVPAEKGAPVFMIRMKLVEREPNQEPGIITQPQVCVTEDQPAVVDIQRASDAVMLFPDIAEACRHLMIGTRFDVRVKQTEAGKARIDLAVNIHQVERAEAKDTFVVGKSFRVIKEVEVGRTAKIVLSKDHQGEPQLWLELMVRDGRGQRGLIPPTADRKHATAETGLPPE